jgi:TolA-binding protein
LFEKIRAEVTYAYWDEKELYESEQDILTERIEFVVEDAERAAKWLKEDSGDYDPKDKDGDDEEEEEIKDMEKKIDSLNKKIDELENKEEDQEEEERNYD